MFRRVYVIQCKATGEFLTENLFYCRSLRRAGRLYDAQEAIDTAVNNTNGDEFEIHSFFEGDPE